MRVKVDLTTHVNQYERPEEFSVNFDIKISDVLDKKHSRVIDCKKFDKIILDKVLDFLVDKPYGRYTRIWRVTGLKYNDLLRYYDCGNMFFGDKEIDSFDLIRHKLIWRKLRKTIFRK